MSSATSICRLAGITNYKSFVADLAHSALTIHHSPFDLIIADVPCTGSGTWSRTAEQLYFFDEKKIDHYSGLQKKIIANVVRSLRPGGFLLYITCSVFKKENEEMIDYIEKEFHLQKLKMESLIGYDKKADTMFAALLSLPKHQKPL
jgi:16S rRNA (cytosine967-C5)-methyltransferase